MMISLIFRPRIFGGFWRLLASLAEAERLYVCEEVVKEYAPREPTAVTRFIEDHPSIAVSLGEFQDWFAALVRDAPSRGLHLVDEQEVPHTEPADPYVVALALMLDGRLPDQLDSKAGSPVRGIVVTEEKPNPAKRPAKIPDVCRAYSLDCISLVDFLELEGYTDSPSA